MPIADMEYKEESIRVAEWSSTLTCNYCERQLVITEEDVLLRHDYNATIPGSYGCKCRHCLTYIVIPEPPQIVKDYMKRTFLYMQREDTPIKVICNNCVRAVDLNRTTKRASFLNYELYSPSYRSYYISKEMYDMLPLQHYEPGCCQLL